MRERVKLEDVARAAGVSRTAASRAINGQPGTTPQARARVLDAVARLGFRPNEAARALAAGRTDAVELLIVDADPDAFAAKPYYGRVVAGALRVLGPRDVPLRVRVVPTVHTDDGAYGRILVNVPAEVAAGMGERTVSLGRSAPGIRYLAPDNVGGAHQAVRHLIGTGRRRVVAVLGPAGNPCAHDRHRGYLDAMADAGRPPATAAGDFTEDGGYRATLRLLAAYPDLDAVFAACDVTAMGVLRALAAAGRSVPGDVAVVGFDGSAVAEAAGLTSVSSPTEYEAELAAACLINSTASPHEPLATALVVRATG